MSRRAGHAHSRKNPNVLLPRALFVLFCLVAAAGLFMGWSQSDGKSNARAREIDLVSSLLDQQKSLIAREQAGVASWKAAYQAVEVHDVDFIADNLGAGLNTYFGHDRAFVLGPDLQSIYAMRDGLNAEPSLFAQSRAQLLPLALKLRRLDRSGALTAYLGRTGAALPQIVETMDIEGQPAIVSLSPIVPDDGSAAIVPGSEYFHISAQFLDAAIAGELGGLMQISGARFTYGKDIGAKEAAIAVRNSRGEAIVWFAWTPEPVDAAGLVTPIQLTASGLAGAILILLLSFGSARHQRRPAAAPAIVGTYSLRA